MLKMETLNLIHEFRVQQEIKQLENKRKKNVRLARSAWAARRLAMRKKKRQVQAAIYNLSLLGIGHSDNELEILNGQTVRKTKDGRTWQIGFNPDIGYIALR